MGRGGQWWECMVCFRCLGGGLGCGLWLWWPVGLWLELRLRLQLWLRAQLWLQVWQWELQVHGLQVWLCGRELLWGWVWVLGRLCVLVSMGGHAWRGRGRLLLLFQHTQLDRGPTAPGYIVGADCDGTGHRGVTDVVRPGQSP